MFIIEFRRGLWGVDTSSAILRTTLRLWQLGSSCRSPNSGSPGEVWYFPSSRCIFPDDIVAVCRHILPRLEAQVNEQKIIRLERERETLLGARVLFIRKIYDEYRRTSPPKSWAHLPPFHRILHSEPFWSLYNVASNVPLDTAMCADAVSQLPAIISRWTNDLRDRLESLVPVTPIFPSPDNPPVVSNLELATSVFICRGWHTDCDNHEFCLIGWDDVRNHVRCSRMFRFKNDELVASNIGRHAASSVIQSLDLDPQKVTAKELDEHDARFLCADCPIIGFRRVTRHEVYTWRECVCSRLTCFRFFEKNSYRFLMSCSTRKRDTPGGCWLLRLASLYGCANKAWLHLTNHGAAVIVGHISITMSHERKPLRMSKKRS